MVNSILILQTVSSSCRTVKNCDKSFRSWSNFQWNDWKTCACLQCREDWGFLTQCLQPVWYVTPTLDCQSSVHISYLSLVRLTQGRRSLIHYKIRSIKSCQSPKLKVIGVFLLETGTVSNGSGLRLGLLIQQCMETSPSSEVFQSRLDQRLAGMV